MYNHELTQIFYDGLGLQDRYILDAASGVTFVSKYEDDVMELIKTVAKNSHHNAAKPFGRGAMPKSIDAKSAKTEMLLKRIEKMAEVQNSLLDRLNIRNGSKGLTLVSLQEASPCVTCSRFDHVEFDCPVMAILGQNMYRQGPSGGPNNMDDLIIQVHILIIIIPLFLTILRRIMDIGGTMMNPILHSTMVSKNKPTLIKDSHRLSRRLNCKPSCKLHARLPASDPILGAIS